MFSFTFVFTSQCFKCLNFKKFSSSAKCPAFLRKDLPHGETKLRTKQAPPTPPLDRRGIVSRLFDIVTPPESHSVSECVGRPRSKLLSLGLHSSKHTLCVSGRVTVRVSLRGGSFTDPDFLDRLEHVICLDRASAGWGQSPLSRAGWFLLPADSPPDARGAVMGRAPQKASVASQNEP